MKIYTIVLDYIYTIFSLSVYVVLLMVDDDDFLLSSCEIAENDHRIQCTCQSLCFVNGDYCPTTPPSPPPPLSTDCRARAAHYLCFSKRKLWLAERDHAFYAQTFQNIQHILSACVLISELRTSLDFERFTRRNRPLFVCVWYGSVKILHTCVVSVCATMRTKRVQNSIANPPLMCSLVLSLCGK